MSSISSISPVPVPELAASVASSSPQSQSTELRSRHLAEYNKILGKRRREMSYAFSSTTPTESDFSGSSQKATNVNVTPIDLEVLDLTPSGMCHDQGIGFASPQTQDFLTLFQQPVSYEFDGRFDSGCHIRDKIVRNRMV